MLGLPRWHSGNESACYAGDLGLEDPLEKATCSRILAMDKGAWWATVHGIAELDMTEHTQTYILFQHP